MKKKRVIAFLLGLMLVFGSFVTSLPYGLTLFAATSSGFTGDFEGNGVYPYGRSKQEITAALEQKIETLNTQIAALNDAGTDLAEAYASGELAAYSNIAGNNGIITNANRRSGWKEWDGAPLQDIKFINSGYSGWGDNYVSWLMYNAVEDKASIVTGKFADAFQNGGNKKIGIALADSFRVTDGDDFTVYQNFSNGYMYYENTDGVEGDVQIVLHKNVTVDGTTVTEIDANANSAGYLGAATEGILNSTGYTAKEMSDMFSQAYDRYSAAEINVGYAFSMVNTNYSIVAQSFRHGDSVASPWDSDPNGDRARWSLLALNSELNKVFLIKDEFFYVYENGGSDKDPARALGAPQGDDFLASDGNRYQNFANGYMQAAGATPSNQSVAKVVSGYHVDQNGTQTEITLKNKVGLLGKSVTVPQGYTQESFSQLFVTAYNQNLADFELSSIEQVSLNNSVIMQVYTDEENISAALAYDETNNTLRYMRPSVYSTWANATDLGHPITDFIQVAQGGDNEAAVFAQGFKNGYIKVLLTTQVDFDEEMNIIEYTVELGYSTIGATYDKQANFFSTINYSDTITEETVSESVADAYDFLNIPDNAELVQKFVDAYNSAFDMGFSCGVPSPEGILWWTTGKSGIVKLTLKGGNGTANFWGDNTIMIYDVDNKIVRISTGTVANVYASEGASGNGWATTDMMINTKTGTIVQQFNITDTDVTNRAIYIIIPDGDTTQASKETGIYDFEANKNGGEWVSYLSQFGGTSISSRPVVIEDEYKAGQAITIDFSEFIVNNANYYLTWKLKSDKGTLSEDGVWTYTPDAGEDFNVEVEVYSAFDKITLNADVNMTGGQARTNVVGIVIGVIAGVLVLVAAGIVVYILIKRNKEK